MSESPSRLERSLLVDLLKQEIRELLGDIADVRMDEGDYDYGPLYDKLARLRCGDYPAPCNCDNTITHESHFRV